MVEGLHLVQVAAGMLVNIDKSTITCSNLSEQEILRMANKLPFRTLDIDDGLKYLGFHLKPNAYLKADWHWLIAKLEQRLHGWSHKWLSRAGRLVLVKSVLEAIPVYWMSLAWIPTGVLEQIRRLCFAFLWKGMSELRALVWVRWEKIAVPKALGGWGLKNIFLFAKALGAKVSWRLIHTQSLWTRVVYHKYIAPLTLLEWIRLGNKSRANCSVVWKAVVQHFSLVGSGLVWRIGNGRLIRIGLDPWVGCRGGHVLSVELRTFLAARGCHFLADIEDPGSSTLWHQGWISAQRLEISDELQGAWEDFLRILRLTNIRLTNRVDELIWDHHPSGILTKKWIYPAECGSS